MQLRHYQNRDLADVWLVASESLRERYDPTLFTQLVPFWPDGLLVIEDLGRVVAFVFGVMSGAQQARVLMLAVDRRYRGAGLGTLLTQEFFRECGKKGVRQVSLEVRASNIGAQRFYQRLGFFTVRRVSKYYSDGEDGILLLRYL
ncbi:MAG: putative N-acetyltransferase [Methanomassiliicoccales archaeon PtaB.Bin215]|nr:MAG: putative N-acetyltransferase [Methanomassiliicoccales archaeon PtaB.Bin215]